MLGLLRRLLNLVIYFEEPEPLERIDDVVRRAIEEFSEDSPRLYSVHRDFFDSVRQNLDALEEAAKRLWRAKPRGNRKSIYICMPNRLSRWTDICVKVATVKEAGRVGIDHVVVAKYYRPWRHATHLVYLEKPSPEELRRKLEELG